MEFDEFMKSRRACLNQALKSQVSDVQIVLGNESCDLDSAVAAVTYAYLLHRQFGHDVIPVLNVNTEDYSLKTEVVYLLSKYHISQSDLVFIDDLDLLRSQGRVNVHLVDHNIPTESQNDLADKVLSIVDHHHQDCANNDKIFIRIEVVSSACTLITDLYYDRLHSTQSQTVAHLLRATILGDSICLSEAAGKVKPLDIAMIEKLEHELNITSIEDRPEVFRQICSAKENVSGLSTDQLLRKDAKKFSVARQCVYMSSMMVHIKVLFARGDVVSSFSSVLHTQQASILSVICSGGKDGVGSKHFILYTHDSRLKTKVMEMVDNDAVLGFEQTSEFTDTDHMSIRKFSNIKISRKQTLPRLREILQVITTSDDLVTKLRADSDQLTFSLELSAPGTPAVVESPAPELYSSHENSGSHTPNPTFHVEAPPNSYMESSVLEAKGAFLPSFNNSEMVQRIMIKKNQIGSDHIEDGIHSPEISISSSGNRSGHNSCPFTPANSFVDRLPTDNYTLPSFNSREMMSRMLQKKQLINNSGDASPIGDDSPNPQIFTPHTSECEGDYYPTPAFDQSDLERRLHTVENTAEYFESRRNINTTADVIVESALEEAMSQACVNDKH